LISRDPVAPALQHGLRRDLTAWADLTESTLSKEESTTTPA